MITIGHYLLFIISLVGMTLSDNIVFSEEEITQFLNYIFDLHNNARDLHGVDRLERTDELDAKALEIYESIDYSYPIYPDTYGINKYTKLCIGFTQLNMENAQRVFSEWYSRKDEYCYFFEPLNIGADPFTSIVWSDTKRIGMTFSTWMDYYTVLVIYDPPGNIKGQYTSNVMLPPSLAVARNPDDNMLTYQGDENRFLYYILELHNQTRENYGAQILEIDEHLNNQASSLLFVSNIKFPKDYRMNTLVRSLHVDFKMDAAEAQELFSEWCNDTAAFKTIVWKRATKFGISMRRFTNTYGILALYSFSIQESLQFINDIEYPQYNYEEESSENE